MYSKKDFDRIAKNLAFTEMRVNGKLYYRSHGMIQQNIGDSVVRGGKVGFKTKAELLRSLQRKTGHATLSALNKNSPKYEYIIIRGYENDYSGSSRKFTLHLDEQRYFLYERAKPRKRTTFEIPRKR